MVVLNASASCELALASCELCIMVVLNASASCEMGLGTPPGPNNNNDIHEIFQISKVDRIHHDCAHDDSTH